MSTILCDRRVWARCPGHEYCGFPANFNEGSECDIYNQHVLAELSADGWISVKDRLPEAFQPVILCREYSKGEYRVEAGYKDIGDWWKIYGTRTKKVTHWMPLPEPPELKS